MASASGPESLEWLLDLMDSIITYRSRYSRSPELLPVIDLLVFDDSNPHGVLFQASVLTRYLERMARELGAASDGDLAGAIERLRAFDLEKLEHLPFNRSYNCAPCIELADLLRDLDSAASELSDWLAALRGRRPNAHHCCSCCRSGCWPALAICRSSSIMPFGLGVERRMTGVETLVGLDDALHQRMTHHVLG